MRSAMLRLATRGSALALAQAGQVAEALGGADLVKVSSDGEPGDKSRFVRGVERALLDGEADVGVHSAKDVPAELTEGLMLAAAPKREDAADAWIGPDTSVEDVPEGARVGTASLRRRAQLLAIRPDLRVSELHGNVDTRLRKLAEGEVEAIVLAVAGLRRLGLEDEVGFRIPSGAMTPAAGQGTLLLQIREGDEETLRAVDPLADERTMRELTAERTVVSLLEADCTSPIGVHATTTAGGAAIRVDAFVGLPDGSEWIHDRLEGSSEEPTLLGAELAQRLLATGAREILERAKEHAP